MSDIEQRKAHLKRAHEMLQKKAALEEIENEKYYQRTISGTSWLIFRIGAVFCLVLAVLITIDFYVDGESVDLPVGTYQYDRPTHTRVNTSVWVGDDFFTPYYKDFVSVDYSSFILTRSFIFNKAKYISFIGHTLGTPERFRAYERISIFDTFPYGQILLIIPLFVWIFKRKSPWFNFFRVACLFLIYPGSSFILIYLFK